MDNYEQKAITTRILAASKVSIQIRNSFYTLEFQEERTIPDIEGVDLETEKALLWQEVNSQVDQQIQDTYYAATNRDNEE